MVQIVQPIENNDNIVVEEYEEAPIAYVEQMQ